MADLEARDEALESLRLEEERRLRWQKEDERREHESD